MENVCLLQNSDNSLLLFFNLVALCHTIKQTMDLFIIEMILHLVIIGTICQVIENQIAK